MKTIEIEMHNKHKFCNSTTMLQTDKNGSISVAEET